MRPDTGSPGPTVIDAASLSALVRAALQAGTLPPRAPADTWVVAGHLRPCTLCSRPIGRDQVGIEFDSVTPEGVREAQPMHVPCFDAWRRETEIWYGLLDSPRHGTMPVRGTERPPEDGAG